MTGTSPEAPSVASRFTQLAHAQPGHERRSILFVNGYLTNRRDCSGWAKSFRLSGWRGNVFLLDWDSGGTFHGHIAKTALGSVVVTEGVAYAVTSAVAWVFPPAGATLASFKLLRWGWRALRTAAAISTAQSIATEHWKAAAKRADAEGKKLGKFLALARPEWGQEELHLKCYSLGARIGFQALQISARRGQVVDSVDLFAGALSARWSWKHARSAVKGKIRNFFSRRDAVLCKEFRTAERCDAIGAVGIRCTFDDAGQIVNCDLSADVASHYDHEAKIGGHKMCRMEPDQ